MADMIFVTKSYSKDIERCRLLCESTQAFLPDGSRHLLVVDKSDYALFRPLQGGRIDIALSEDFLPFWMLPIPGLPTYRLNLFGLPVRGWILQQILKIAVAATADEAVVNFLDSDVVLTRPLPVERIIQNDKSRLQRTRHSSAKHRKWEVVAQRLLGVMPTNVSGDNFIGNLITWKRDNVVAMLARIEDQARRPWLRVLSRTLDFSEYFIYGNFIDQVVGIEGSGHFYDGEPNLALFWGDGTANLSELDRFFSSVPVEALGVMIHSKLGYPVGLYKSHIEKLWRISN